MHRSIVCAVIIASISYWSREVVAESELSSSQEIGEVDSCSPSCVNGQICRAHICVSPCASPCRESEVCTRGGHCVSKHIPVPAPTMRTLPLSSHPGSATLGTGTAAKDNDEIAALDMATYERSRIRKNIGVALMTIGGLCVAGAIAMGGVAGALEDEVLLYSAIGVEILGDALFFPGLAAMIRGKRGMGKAMSEKNRADHPRFDVQPLTTVDTTKNGNVRRFFGLTLSVTL